MLDKTRGLLEQWGKPMTRPEKPIAERNCGLNIKKSQTCKGSKGDTDARQSFQESQIVRALVSVNRR